MKKLELLLILLIFYCVPRAQKIKDENVINTQIIEYLTENGIDPEQNMQVFNDLIEQSEHKLNIHATDQKFLENLLFLSDFQIQHLLEFIKINSPIYSKYQLQGIKGFTPELIEMLSLFVDYGDLTKHTPKNYLNGSVLLRDSYDMETPIGYNKIDSTGYLGDKHHLYQKSIFEYGTKLTCGFVYEKDPGEKFTDNNNNPEYLSGFIQYTGNKVLQKIIIGDFSANFGQGLSMWSGSSLGKAGDIFLIKKRGEGIKKYSSTNETDFLRGVASSFKWRSLNLTTYYSFKKIDANIQIDSLNDKIIATSFPATGYHRTLNELNNKNTAERRTYGIDLQYRIKNLTLSTGTFYQEINVDHIQNTAVYKQLNYPDNKTNNSYIAYNYGNSNFVLFGECASTSNFNLAITNGVLIKPASNISASVLYRNFSMKYYSPWNNSFTESSNPNGESGFFVGISAYPIKKIEFQGYLDLFKFRWLEYNINKPSHGYEISLKTVYTPNSQTNIYLQYREKEKAKNISEDQSITNIIDNYNLKRIRSNLDYEIKLNLSLQCRIERSFYRANSTSSSGSLIYCSLNYQIPKPRLSFWLRYGIFDMDDYNARIYAYENDVLYNFSIPAFQDKGSRAYLLSKWKIQENIIIWFKLAQTWYSNKKEIGSGLQTVNSNTKTNFKIQLQIKI